MKMMQVLLPMLVFPGLILTSVFVHAQDDQSGFISIDCGIVEGSTYTDNLTNIKYVSDAEFIDSGEIHNILKIYNSIDVDTQLTTLRSFPENTRNCYTLKPTQGKGNRYLIRARFMYGNYDFKGQLPEFDVYLGPDYWETIIFTLLSAQGNIEIIHVLLSDYIHVCLVNTGRGTPFISAIELRLLPNSMYKETDYGSLYLFARVDFGLTYKTVRYNDDRYDRIWRRSSLKNTSYLFTSEEISTGFFSTLAPPNRVMRTAITPANPNDSINLMWSFFNATDRFILYMHYAEIELLKRNQKREFNINMNGNLIYGPYSPLNLTTMTIYSTEPETVAPNYTLTINKTKNSTLPPLINALELYILRELPQMHTNDQDAAAMWSIKSTYRLKKYWQGDPCVPQDFVWDGIGCSYNTTNFPRIVLLNLSSTGLNGGLDPWLANLTMMHTLDLSNNNFTGTVPNFLSELNFLKVLNLKGNNFVGSVPAGLLAKANKGSLSLSFDEESTGAPSSSCEKNSCKNKKDNKIIVPVISGVASVVVIFTVLTALWMIKKKKARGRGLEIRKQQYTYSEVQSITYNFNVIIGKGGFGTVYHGRINDTQVAVKMLSESSLQGDKEFQAEAYLLLSVHHKNLTSLVGYCNEGNRKGIIYEYMSNGNIENHLFSFPHYHDTNSRLLNWEKRLQIGCDAARGLEYLHHGCKPPIVHRDIKCTNILLNETFQAKLADFGLSKAFPTEGGTHISTVVAGTPGYLDPEYYTSNRLTEKSDVYSFGVVLLVLITGQPAITQYENDNIHISRLVNLKLADGDMNNIVDPKLIGDFDINTAWKAVELAMACVARTPIRRPTMNEVVMELNDCLITERDRLDTKQKSLSGYMSLNLDSAHDLYPI